MVCVIDCVRGRVHPLTQRKSFFRRGMKSHLNYYCASELALPAGTRRCLGAQPGPVRDITRSGRPGERETPADSALMLIIRTRFSASSTRVRLPVSHCGFPRQPGPTESVCLNGSKCLQGATPRWRHARSQHRTRGMTVPWQRRRSTSFENARAIPSETCRWQTPQFDGPEQSGQKCSCQEKNPKLFGRSP
jgi:hypothetical protein